MKPFESFLAQKIEEYISYRQSLGYTLKNIRSNLRHLDRYLKQLESGETDFKSVPLQPLFFLNFRESIKGESSMITQIMGEVRRFFQFLVRGGMIEENPLQDIPRVRHEAFIPFVFSEKQIERLLKAITDGLRKEPRYFLKDISVYLAILLQARCGLRISEPLRLLRSHYYKQEKCLYIEKTKFKKDRLIPIPSSLVDEINNYLAVRKSLVHDDQNPYLLYANKERGLSKDSIYRVFRQAVKTCGFDQTRWIKGNTIFSSPTTHSLRHSFAINTLKRIKERGKSPQDALPVLAAYMGHCKYQYTAIYLKVLDAQQRQGLVNFVISHL
jgi:integrase/recombinase XerD